VLSRTCQRTKNGNLFRCVADRGDPTERVLRETPALGLVFGGHDVMANLCRKAKQREDLRDPSAGDAFPAGDGGLVGDLAGVELAMPLDGLAKRLDDARRADPLRRSRWARLAAGWRNRVDDLAGRHPPRQGNAAAALERRVRPQGDLDGLFAVRRRRRAGGGRKTVVEGDVDNPEDDLRLGARAVNTPTPCNPFVARSQGSNTVTFGEVFPPPRNPVAFLLTARGDSAVRAGRCKSANQATLRSTCREAALSVCISTCAGPNATPRFPLATPPKTLKLSASLG